MSDPRDQYKATTLRILGSFQLLEHALKVYISFAYQLIQESVSGKLHFGYSTSDVEAAPLERLLNTFAKLNGNADLIKRLNNLRSERNHIAHQSLLIALGKNYDLAALIETEEAFLYMEDELGECLQLVLKELRGLKATLFPAVA